MANEIEQNHFNTFAVLSGIGSALAWLSEGHTALAVLMAGIALFLWLGIGDGDSR